MTEKQADDILQEMLFIEKRLDVLDSNNAIESQEIERLLERVDCLGHIIHCELTKLKKRKPILRVIS